MNTSEKNAAIFVRLRGPLYDRLEDWRRSQTKIPSRSHALRLLIERALDPPDNTTAGEIRQPA